MATAPRTSRLRIAIVALIALFGCALLALAPATSTRADRTQALAERLRVSLPDVSIDRSRGLFARDELYVSVPGRQSPASVRRIARVRPLGDGKVRVRMYDPRRDDYGSETWMDVDTLVSRIGQSCSDG